MPFQLLLPDIGEGVVEAEVQRWLVAPGDTVEEDQPLVEVMTDKATVVIPSPRRGRIVKLLWNVGDLAKVHAPLVEIETGQEPVRAPAGATQPSRVPVQEAAQEASAAGGDAGRGDVPSEPAAA